MKKSDSFYKTFPFVFIITFVVGGILFFIDRTWSLGFVLGNLTSLFMMSQLNKSSYKIVESKTKQDAQKLAVRNYVFRFFFYAIILVVAGFHPSFNLITTMIGLFVFKVVLYIISFLDSRGEENND